MSKNDETLYFGDLPILRAQEVRNFFLSGSVGTGKTLAIFNALECISRRKNQKKIIYDFKGEYIKKFYNSENCLIFNPLDQRRIKWNLFNELQGGELEQSLICKS